MVCMCAYDIVCVHVGVEVKDWYHLSSSGSLCHSFETALLIEAVTNLLSWIS